MKSYKTELDLNNKQKTACLRHSGVARFAYNWGLRRKIEAYQAGEKTPSAIDLHKELVVLKKIELPWLYETSSKVPQHAFRHLDKAYQNFFRKCKNGSVKKGFPKFKSRKQGIGAFTLNGYIRCFEKGIQLPHLGTLRLKEANYFPTNITVISATISERAGHWFVSILTKEEPFRQSGTETIGVDVGIKTLATLSDGTIFENPRALKKAEKKLKFLQRSVTRKQKGSNNRKKANLKLAKQHLKVSNVRKDSLHKVSDAIIKRSALIGIESLNVQGMMKNHCLAKALSDAAMSELHRQIRYKASWARVPVVEADRWFPSSKLC